ncbi:hypothetical protein [Flavobacterium sp. GSB-24]|uniref:hypothetical protein n=1 Tax=Flavobacterium sp. GSB-24 TaxID=2994319 RepID=UPI00248F506D|nr:hypothetical protein [Flavobacterium sp. GSB-24]BDU27696.1 hypothetical protein FLGSB24_44400 [Flavobacterium sp. GSB-24]
MQTHWCRKLNGGIGREIESKALNIEKLERDKADLIRKLDLINMDIQIQEYELLESISQEWSKKEIQLARENI